MFRRPATFILLIRPLSGITQIPDGGADLNGDMIVNVGDTALLSGCLGQNPIANTACTSADVDAVVAQ